MIKNSLVLIIVTVLCVSCGVNRFIPEGETLYKGASFNINATEETTDLNDIKQELSTVLSPQPNNSSLGLLAHYKVKEEKAGFLYKFINKKIGQPPIYQSNVNVERTKQIILNRLENLGFFYSEVTSQIKKGTKKSKVVYDVKLKQPYVMETYQVDTDTTLIYKEIQRSLDQSILQKGIRFNLSNLEIERKRIDARLKERGYYNFNADFLIFELDTNQYKTKRFDLYVRLKKNVPPKALVPYALKTVNIYPLHSVTNKNLDTTKIDGVNFIQDSLFFKSERLRPFILYESGKRYDPNLFRATSKRLSSIGIYKFVNVQFDENEFTEKDSIGYLNTTVYLSALNKRAISAELQANTKSSGFTGPALALSYTDRNLFKGGEILKVTGNFGFETQLGSNATGRSGLTSTQLGLRAELLFPRLLFPIKITERFDYAIPKTKISLGTEYLNRSRLFSLSSFNASFGYQWNTSEYIFHTLNPIRTSLVNLSNTTPEFEDILNDNPFLRNSFEQELISGLTYNFTYNQLGNNAKKSRFFFSSNIELVGNTLSLLGSSRNDIENKTLLGIEFAQYAKADADFRIDFNLKKENHIVTRLYAGLGYAYGNSDVVPFSRQFFSGGPYSVRAFRTRSIGPGIFTSEGIDSFFDSAGDIKLEANIEYRFPLYSYLKGAFFIDAGNVWLRNENEALPGGQFTSNFLNELAIGSGFGIRLDVQGFVLRLDWAVPFHNPTVHQINDYRFDINNSVLNFAIGYPF